jgi:penicillin-binding protein 1B
LAKKGAPARGGAKKRPAAARVGLRGWLRAFGRSLVAGGLIAAAIIAAVEWHWALGVVDRGLEAPTWSVPGRVVSAPLVVWEGEQLDADTLAVDLAAAGYARVPRASQPGDFQVSADAVHIVLAPAKGPGWSVPAGEALVTFREGRVGSVTPDSQLELPPATLAIVRGDDNENRNPVPLERIPRHMIDAVLAIEDARFYDHAGIDPLGILRALVRNASAGRMVQGGSTLTQQLVKNLFLSVDRTAERKVQEALIALALEHRRTKDEILALYLNEIYLGQSGGSSICGVDAAARAFFAKPIDRVSIAEAATIAGMIQSPNPYSPVRHPAEAKARRDVVLARMAELGFIDAAVLKRTLAEDLATHASASGRTSPWAVDLAVEQAEAGDEGRVAREALVVQTTIQPQLQRLAEAAVRDGLAEVIEAHPKLSGVQAAFVAVRARDGAVVAMVGGRDYGDSAFNRVVNSPRQIGSTVKPLTLLAAFEVDPALSPAALVDDSPIEREVDGKRWVPANYDGTWAGPLPLRDAISRSRNIPAVLLAERLGLPVLRARLDELGLSRATAFPSASLGGFSATPLELAGAYTPFAAGGVAHRPWLVRAVAAGDKLVVDAPPTRGTVRYSPRATFLTWDVLRTAMTEGTARGASRYDVGPGAAGKTGTTDDYADAWFAGAVGPYAVVAWVGYDRPRSIGLTGGAAALPIWGRFAHATGFDRKAVAAPAGLVQTEVCVATGTPPCADCTATRMDWFSEGAVPIAVCANPPVAGATAKSGWELVGELFGFGRPEE